MTGEDELDEDALRDSEVLPTRRPHPVVIAASVTARGGALWLPVAGLMALCGREKAAKRALTAAAIALPLGHLVSLVVRRRRPPAAAMPARRCS